MHEKERCLNAPTVSVTSDPSNYNPSLNIETTVTLTQTMDPQSKHVHPTLCQNTKKPLILFLSLLMEHHWPSG